MPSPLFLNTWQKGSSENANLGNGVFVGIETYSKKGVAQLTKDSFKTDGGVVTDLPLYIAQVEPGIAFVQGETGKVYYATSSSSPYDTWTDITNASSSGLGQGIIYFQGYLFAFRGGNIDYNSGTTSSWTQTNWQPNGSDPVLDADDPLPILIFPNDGFIYFGNGFRVGKLGFGTSTTFNPGGSGVTDYFYTNSTGNANGLLPSFYQITSISFLPTNYIALGTSSSFDSDVADIILWNPTLSTYETPLRLYSQANRGENGVKQLINRNNTLYATVGGSHSIFRTNGQSFSLVADFSLSSNIRKTTGMQAQLPVFMNPRVSAIDVFGNKILTGVSTSDNISSYPTGYGLFPCGVWTIALEGSSNAINYESDSIQCEYTISTGTVVAVNREFVIGFLKCVGANQTLIGWQDGTSFGVDLVDTVDYQSDISNVMVESEMMEIGTPLTPETIQNIQFNTPRQLLVGQTVQFNYRTGFDQDYTPIIGGAFTSVNNVDGGYKIPLNAIGATKYLQLQIQMSSTSDLTYSPEIRNIIVSP